MREQSSYRSAGPLLAAALAFGVFCPCHAAAKDLPQLTKAEQHIARAFGDVHSGDLQAALALPQQGFLNLTVDPMRVDIPQPEKMPVAKVKLADMRLILAQLSFAGGANNSLSVVRAQGAKNQLAVTVQGGSITLSELRRVLETRFPDEDLSRDDVINVPLAIWADSQLVLEPGDELLLSRSAGAFVANFGRLHVVAAKIASHGSENLFEPSFRPFVATAGSGFATITNSALSELGFGTTAAFSGVSFMNGGLYPALGRTVLKGNQIENSGTVTLKGTQGAVVAGNVFLASSKAALATRGATNTWIASNAFASNAAGSAIKIFENSARSQVRGNLILRAAVHGIEVDGAGAETEISNNLLWSNKQAGVFINRSDCVDVSKNLIFKNSQKGILLRTSRGSQINRNEIFANKGAGLHVSRQPVGTLTHVRSNNLVGNRVGLNSTSASILQIQGNNFADQFPRMLSGDVVNQSDAIFRDLLGETAETLVSGGVAFFGLSPISCSSFVRKGT